jgi:hypothetical protein
LFSLAALAVLAGCASLAHHPDDSFAHTAALAEADDPDAQLDLARMYADPAAWPQAADRQPDPTRAAEWCIIVSWGPPPTPAALARGPSCEQILAAFPPYVVSAGSYLASVRLEGPVSRNR